MLFGNRAFVALGLFAGWFPLVCAGCGGASVATHPVEGQIVRADGSPLDTGRVEFRGTASDGSVVNAHGRIESNGTFRLTTFTEGDGAIAGEHQVIVLNPAVTDGDGPAPPDPFPARYRSYESSGLTANVEPGENKITLQLEAK